MMVSAKRVSGLLVTDQFEDVCAAYEQLGLTAIGTDEPGCRGYEAGGTGIILVDRAFAERSWGAAVAGSLAGQFVPYLFVEHIDDARVGEDSVLADVLVSGTREQVRQIASGLVVLAERAG